MANRCVLDPTKGPIYYDKDGRIVPYPRGNDAAAKKAKLQFNRLNCSSPKNKSKKSVPKKTPNKVIKPSASKKAAQLRRPLPPVPAAVPKKGADKRSPIKSRSSPPSPPSKPGKSKTKSHYSRPPAPPSKEAKSKTPKLGKPPARKPPSRKVTEDKLLVLQKGNIAGNLAAERRHRDYINRNK